jgi:hypothetical protein
MFNKLGTRQTSITRKWAAECGLSRFYTGVKCRSGHLAERYVSNGQCVQCNREKAISREREKCASDPSYRAYRSVQRRSGQTLNGHTSPRYALGCSLVKLKEFIERQFTEGMSWLKYGQWEIDHVIPLSAARSKEELVKLCHYTNLQPLWKRENLVKGGA